MADHPTSIVIKHILEGDFLAASRVVADHGLPGQTELIRAAEFLSVTTWLARYAEAEPVRREAGAVLEAVSGISPAWVAKAEPRPPVAAQMPHRKAEFDRLMVRALGDRGYYHPIRLPTVEGLIPPNRANTRSDSVAYHAAEWELARPLLERACGGSLSDKLVVDLGCADGFFSLTMARAGARVVAVDIAVTMILRTAVFAALNGLHRRVLARLGPTLELPRILQRIAAADPAFPRVDAVCALGLIYHFDDLEGDLAVLTGLGVPILFEFNATAVEDEAAYDPTAHRNPRPVSMPWLTGWLRMRGFEVIPEPAWRKAAARLGGHPDAPDTAAGTTATTRQEMLLALPIGPLGAETGRTARPGGT